MTASRALPSLVTVIEGRSRVVCCHKATLSGNYVPNSLDAVAECVAARVPRLEIDVRFLADNSMLVYHDATFERESTGEGRLDQASREDAGAVRYRQDERVKPAFLEEVVDLIRGSSSTLQVDLKHPGLLTRDQAAALCGALFPIREQTITGSQAHWNLRPLDAAGLPVAFDPTLHWHFAPQRSGGGLAPATLGVHGLWDDSPLARVEAVPPAAYVRTRIDDLNALVDAREWMVDLSTILHFRDLGVTLGEELGARGIALAAWTLPDQGRIATMATLHGLFAAGATTIITNAPVPIASYLA